MDRNSSIDAVASAVEGELLDLGGHTSPDGAVTLLFSDIEGSTELMERLGDRRWHELIRDHNAIVRGLADAHDGTVVKSQGDGFMLAFGSSHAALRCAIEMARAFAGKPSRRAAESFRVRIGLHAGFAIADADDFYGRNVVLAARIADRAQGGQILVSSAVKEYTQSDPGIRFQHHANLRLKGLPGEHALYEIRWNGGAGG